MRALLLASALFVGSFVGAQAQEALYGPQPPKGSAYVRVVSALDAKADVKPDFRAALSLGTGTSDRVSAYDVVEAVAGKKLSLSVSVGGKTVSGTASADPDGFLTILLLPDAAGAKIVGVTDVAEFNQTKARLAFYNAIAGCAGGVLALDPGGQAVFKDVDGGSQKTRAVNPTTANVKASCTDKSADPIALSGLEQGGMNSVFLVQSAGKPVAFVVKDVATPYHH
ncbi:MAG: alginate O-acetyltransferase AlgF [Acetobacteraceae bacterium]|nr:alginate O-acetyltransferase AlgF [Acetobacteraceae bacterium]